MIRTKRRSFTLNRIVRESSLIIYAGTISKFILKTFKKKPNVVNSYLISSLEKM